MKVAALVFGATVVALVGVFVFYGGTVSAGDFNSTCNSKDTSGGRKQCWIDKSNGHGGIYSVDWAAGEKATYKSDNVCSLWIGPIGDTKTTTISVNSTSDIKNGQYPAAMYGMCTGSGLQGVADNFTADRIRIEKIGEVDYSSIFDGLPTEFVRGSWGDPTTGTRFNLNVNEIRRLGTESGIRDGKVIYSVTTSVHRCHKGVDESIKGACSNNDVEIELLLPIDYYGRSTVTVGSDSADTGIVSSFTERVASTSVSSGDTVNISFSHNLYSSYALPSNVTWKVEASESASNGLTYSSANDNGDSGTASLVTKSGEYYTTTNGKISRDMTYSVKLTGKGTYRLCESRTAEYKGVEFPETRVCAEVTVSESNNSYYAISNVSVRDSLDSTSKWKTTGMTSYGSAIDTLDSASVGQEIYIVFSHNIYAASPKKNVGWELGRPTTVSGSGFSLVGKSFCGYDRVANFDSSDGNSNGFYVGDPRECTDGSNDFITRDIYTIKFSEKSGQAKVCQTVSVDGSQKTEVCAIVTPKVCDTENCGISSTPCDEFGSLEHGDTWGRTYTVSRVRNNTVSSMGSWDTSVYAKPEDSVSWIHCYYPGVQKIYDKTVSSLHASHSTAAGARPTNTNVSFSSFGLWENRFVVSSTSHPGYSDSRSFSKGDASIQEPSTNPNSYKVRTSDDSDILEETITTGSPSYVSYTNEGKHSWGCDWGKSCSKCGSYSCNCTTSKGSDGKTTKTCSTCCYSCYRETCRHSNDYISNTRYGTASSSASVLVPYNFIAESTVALSAEVQNGEPIVYAGETASLSYLNTQLMTRYNSKTDGTYATQSDDAKIKLVAYVSSSNIGDAINITGSGSTKTYNICGSLNGWSQCAELDSWDGVTLNSERNLKLDSSERTLAKEDEWISWFGKKYDVFDAKAGDYYCVVAAVYPHTSGASTNMSSSGDGSWYVSAPSCVKIAKKPSFQVRGGSVYSEGSINTSVSNKNNVNGIYSYIPFGSGMTAVFGSWAEQSVVANGIAKGIASGAATSNTGSLEGGTPNYCSYRVPLSFANYGPGICTNIEQTGASGINVTSANKDALLNYWWVLDAASIDETDIDLDTNYVDAMNLNGDSLRYVYSNNNIRIKGYTIRMSGMQGVTYVVRSWKSATITGDLKYADNEALTMSSMIPKLIIYAKNGINISCNVNRVDAILITDGTVNTCVGSNGLTPDISSAERSRQLTINGVIMANKVLMNRTYGNGAGRASGVPAEIVNYDVSSILWGRAMVEANDFETITTVYQQELAPRY